MKIHQLPQGARFEYEGEEYVKTGPLFASGSGGQRLIPKYAVLKPLDPVGQMAATATPEALSREKTLKAFAGFYAECSRLLPEQQKMALEAARMRFLKALD